MRRPGQNLSQALEEVTPHLLRWRSKCAALARTSGLVVVGGGRRAGANLVMSPPFVIEPEHVRYVKQG